MGGELCKLELREGKTEVADRGGCLCRLVVCGV